jgi:hypothetical protein
MIFGAFIASTAILILREKIAEQNIALEKKQNKKLFKQAYKITGLQQLISKKTHKLTIMVSQLAPLTGFYLKKD